MKVTARLLPVFIFFFLVLTLYQEPLGAALTAAYAYVARRLNIPTDMRVLESLERNVLPYHEAALLIDSRVCDGGDVFFLVFVKSHPEHTERRAAIRDTWGRPENWGEDPALAGVSAAARRKFAVLFMFGEAVTAESRENLERESRLHGDVVQADFAEDFYSLTLKLIAQLRWTADRCPQSRYFMTTDDDVFVHTQNLMRYLNLEVEPDTGGSGVYRGLVHSGSAPERSRKIKYHVPAAIYPGLYYPDYCPGAGYVLSTDVVHALLEQLHRRPVLFIDDVYTGLLAHDAGVQPVHDWRFYGESTVATAPDSCVHKHFFTSHRHLAGDMRSFFEVVRNFAASDAGRRCR